MVIRMTLFSRFRMKKDAWFRRYLAEALGTFILVFGGTSAILASSLGLISNGDIIIPVSFGLSLMVGVFALGHISGAHFNPAITIGLWIGKHFKKEHVLPYILSQIAGAIVASIILFFVFGEATGFTVGATTPSTAPFSTSPEVGVLIYEFIGTFILAFAIVSVATDDRTRALPNGLVIGGTLMALAFATGWVGGGSFNPARTLGPAIVGGTFDALWVYMVAPVLGGIAAVKTYNYLK